MSLVDDDDDENWIPTVQPILVFFFYLLFHLYKNNKNSSSRGQTRILEYILLSIIVFSSQKKNIFNYFSLIECLFTLQFIYLKCLLLLF